MSSILGLKQPSKTRPIFQSKPSKGSRYIYIYRHIFKDVFHLVFQDPTCTYASAIVKRCTSYVLLYVYLSDLRVDLGFKHHMI